MVDPHPGSLYTIMGGGLATRLYASLCLAVLHYPPLLAENSWSRTERNKRRNKTLILQNLANRTRKENPVGKTYDAAIPGSRLPYIKKDRIWKRRSWTGFHYRGRGRTWKPMSVQVEMRTGQAHPSEVVLFPLCFLGSTRYLFFASGGFQGRRRKGSPQHNCASWFEVGNGYTLEKPVAVL